ncbi:MAG: DUF504 domain-containing protein [Myxococcales bacterium]|nr:DUF504 domain-containing protein [Myxococcales bacterium]
MGKAAEKRKKAEEPARGPFRTGRQVYDQLRWDRRFDTAACWIEMQERFSGTKKVPFDGFDPNEVPWHRIERFTYSGEVIWDRAERIDRLADVAGQEGPAVATFTVERVETEEADWIRWSRRQLRSLALHARRCYRFDTALGRWLPWEGGLFEEKAPNAEASKENTQQTIDADVEPVGPVEISADASQRAEAETIDTSATENALRVVTWNVLSERYAAGFVQPNKRMGYLLAELQKRDADVIGLQEVESGLVQELLREPWVRKNYWVSEDETGQAFAERMGQLILMKRPFVLQDLRLSGEKHVLLAHFALGGKLSFAACLHLSSDLSKLGHFIRAIQVQILCHLLAWQSTQPAQTRLQALDREEILSICAQGWELVQQRGILLGDLNEDPQDRAWYARKEIPEELHGVDLSDFPNIWEALERAGFVDTWPMLKLGAPGETFDPQHNPLASTFSATGRRRRLDAVWLSDPSATLMPEDARLFGYPSLRAEEGLLSKDYPSDHFGLDLVFSVSSEGEDDALLSELSQVSRKEDSSEGLMQSAERIEILGEVLTMTKNEKDKQEECMQRMSEAPPTYHSALIVMPPPELWDAIQAIRKEYDKSFHRWMPHINLVYGFVDAALFSDAAALIQDALADVEPFTVTFSKIRHFRHGKSDTIWLEPGVNPAPALQRLQARLQALFPSCDEQIRKSEAGFTPHLTLGQVRGEARSKLSHLVQAWQQDWQPIQFTVDHVALISRSDEQPFRIQERVLFGGARPPQGPQGKGQSEPPEPSVTTEDVLPKGEQALLGTPETQQAVSSTEQAASFKKDVSLVGASASLGHKTSEHEQGASRSHGVSEKKDVQVKTFSEKAHTEYTAYLRRLEQGVASEQQRYAPILSAMRAACEAICWEGLKEPPSWQAWWPLGSLAFGAQTLHSDVDILCLGTLPREAFQAQLVERLEKIEGIDDLRVIWDARVPLLKVGCAGWSADLLYARIPEELEPLAVQETLDGILERVQGGDLPNLARELSLEAWDIASQRSLLGLLDGLYLRGMMARYACQESFVDLLRTIKCWTAQEQIAEQAKGYLGGISWAILVGWLCSHPAAWGETDRLVLLEAFFSTFSQSSWMQPIGVVWVDRSYEEDPSGSLMPIYTPVVPQRNSARQVTAETFAHLRQALQKGRETLRKVLLGKATWESMLGSLGVSAA